MNNTNIIFQDRKDAGQKLAITLKSYAKDAPIILAMPRGGVVVAYEVAKALNAPLDVIVTRKIGAPTQPEYAIGAIAPENIQIFNREAISYGNFSETEIATIVTHEKKEIERRIKLYRGNRPPLNLKNEVVIIVDDGAATGQTAIIAIRYAHKLKARKIIFACGVGAPDAIKYIKQEADEVVCLNLPEMFHSVSQWYLNFAQTTDEEVINLLNLSKKK